VPAPPAPPVGSSSCALNLASFLRAGSVLCKHRPREANTHPFSRPRWYSGSSQNMDSSTHALESHLWPCFLFSELAAGFSG
jgi:hypothetical protein